MEKELSGQQADVHYMEQALREARLAFECDEVPVGAVVVLDDRIIARGHNQTEKLTDCTAHAEMIALTSACNYLGSKYLQDATLYVTLEPCLMCAGALFWSRIGRVVYGAADDKNGYRKTAGDNPAFHPRTVVESGVRAGECMQLMRDFFAAKRGRGM
jgi:tRNA(adenine34) deaminase